MERVIYGGCTPERLLTKTNRLFSRGFRIPSIAERLVAYQLGNIIVLPNNNIQPEPGYTAELGYKRSFNLGSNWRRFFDVATFWNEFRNMIEFTLTEAKLNPTYNPDSSLKPVLDWDIQAYFQSRNVTKARIFGWELSLMGEGKIGKHLDLSLQGEHTYFYGRYLTDTTAKNQD